MVLVLVSAVYPGGGSFGRAGAITSEGRRVWGPWIALLRPAVPVRVETWPGAKAVEGIESGVDDVSVGSGLLEAVVVDDVDFAARSPGSGNRWSLAWPGCSEEPCRVAFEGEAEVAASELASLQFCL
jgi:hypothetical protein